VVNRIQVVSLLIILLSFTGCKEDTKAHYAAAADASADRSFELGWLPEVLRSEAVEIREFS
jgi:hypothetical protein